MRCSSATASSKHSSTCPYSAASRPIAKSRLGKPVEFGYKAHVCDNDDGLILDHSVHIGNPHDTDLLLPAVKRIVEHCGAAPVMLTADRGYCASSMENELTVAGVATVVISRLGSHQLHESPLSVPRRSSPR